MKFADIKTDVKFDEYQDRFTLLIDTSFLGETDPKLKYVLHQDIYEKATGYWSIFDKFLDSIDQVLEENLAITVDSVSFYMNDENTPFYDDEAYKIWDDVKNDGIVSHFLKKLTDLGILISDTPNTWSPNLKMQLSETPNSNKMQQSTKPKNTPTYHALEIDSISYKDVVRERKTTELRYNDRNFKVGDYLVLIEIKTGLVTRSISDSFNEETFPTGETVLVQITYILDHHQCNGLNENFVMLSFIRC